MPLPQDRRTRRRAGCVAVICALATAMQAPHAHAQDALTGYDFVFTIRQETADERGRVRREPGFVARARTRTGAVRVDFLPGTEGSNVPGDWYLTRDAGRTVTMVDERGRSYFDLSAADLRERLRADKRLEVSVGDIVVSVRREGACGAVAGWPTECVLVERRYVARTRHLLVRSTTEVVDSARFWIATGVPDLTIPLGTFFVSRLDLLARHDSTFVARERAIARALRPGSMLRMELVHTERDGRARAVTTRVVEASRVVRATHDDRIFDVPPGYRLLRR